MRADQELIYIIRPMENRTNLLHANSAAALLRLSTGAVPSPRTSLPEDRQAEAQPSSLANSIRPIITSSQGPHVSTSVPEQSHCRLPTAASIDERSNELSVSYGRVERARGLRAYRGRRKAGHKNYTEPELNRLLDIISEVEPLGANHWAVVCEKYNTWTEANGLPKRDDTMLKQKFDRLANTNKSTGDPTCPTEVRRAKRIARSILGKAQAVALGGSQNSDSENDEMIDLTVSNIGSNGSVGDRVGARSGSRAIGARGVRQNIRRHSDDRLFSCMNRIADKFELMADTVINDSTSNVEQFVREEVSRALAPTIESLNDIKKLLSQVLQ